MNKLVLLLNCLIVKPLRKKNTLRSRGGGGGEGVGVRPILWWKDFYTHFTIAY